MVYNDPLADYKVQWISTYVAPYFPFGTLSSHFHEVFFFYLFYSFVFRLSQFVSPRLVPKPKWNAMKPKDQIYFHIHVVSFVQCLVILVIIVPFFFQEHLEPTPETRIFGYVPYGGFVAAAASGYFFWDAFTAIVYMKLFGPGFAIHGIISLFVSFVTYQPYILYYAPMFLLFEISTPFLNIRWFDLKVPGIFNEKAILVNNIILIILFFVVRICWGWYWIYWLASDLLAVRNDPRSNMVFSILIVSGNFVLDILNVYWFSLMSKIAIKTIKKLITGDTARLQIDEETIKKKSS